MRFLVFCLAFLTVLSHGYTQSTDATVSSIEISGAHKMDKDFLLQRITTKLHQTTSWQKLDYDQVRLNRLNGIQHTVIEVDTLADATLRIRLDIVGQKSIKPFVGLGRVEGNFWWQVGAAEYNFAHKNQTLLGFFMLQDGRPNGKLYFENPYYKGRDWGYSINAFHNASVEPLFFKSGAVSYLYDLTGLGLTGFNHFGLLDKLSYGLTFFNETYQRQPGSGLVLEGPDFQSQKKILASIGYIHDKVKYDFFYRTGFQHQVLAQSVSTIGVDLQFVSFSYEGRHYWKLGPSTNIAGQLRMAISTNNDTPFAPYVLDSNFNLRGVGNRIDRATAQFVFNIEVRQAVLHHRNVAIQVVAFSDSGSWRNPGADFDVVFKKENFRSFVGGGVRFILTKVFDSVVRVDYGVDVFDNKTQGLVIGFGQFF